MQPACPALHRGPPRLTTMWPTSPAAPRPSQGFPLRIEAAADAGAPEVRRARSCTACRRPGGTRPRPRPGRRCRPRPASRARPRAAPRAGTSPPSRAGCARRRRRPSSRRRRPASRPRRPCSAVVSTPAASAASRSAPAIAVATSLGPPSVGVGRRASPSTLLRALTTTVWILVPPRSMPPRADAGAGLTRETINPRGDGSYGVILKTAPSPAEATQTAPSPTAIDGGLAPHVDGDRRSRRRFRVEASTVPLPLATQT